MKKTHHEQQPPEPIKKAAFWGVWTVLLTILLIWVFSSCNVTRTVTTSATHYQRGDTTVTIVTKTTESYDGSVKRDNILK